MEKINKFLVVLDLSDNDINNDKIKFIIESLKINKSLTTLKLYGSNIDEKEIDIINELLEFNMINKERIVKERAEEKIYFATIMQYQYSWYSEFLKVFDTFAGYEYL